MDLISISSMRSTVHGRILIVFGRQHRTFRMASVAAACAAVSSRSRGSCRSSSEAAPSSPRVRSRLQRRRSSHRRPNSECGESERRRRCSRRQASTHGEEFPHRTRMQAARRRRSSIQPDQRHATLIGTGSGERNRAREERAVSTDHTTRTERVQTPLALLIRLVF